MGEDQLHIKFIGSFTDVRQCPEDHLPEYCFIGRSNVGKSSMINCITGQKEMARTSAKPGKTQAINLFTVGEPGEWNIADLPGYGFARVSKSSRAQWSKLIHGYIRQRDNLCCTFLLIDIRHPQQENDRVFMNNLGEQQVPFCLLFTKADKLKPEELSEAVEKYKSKILEDWELLPPYFITSSQTGMGRAEILEFIHKTNAIFAKHVHP